MHKGVCVCVCACVCVCMSVHVCVCVCVCVCITRNYPLAAKNPELVEKLIVMNCPHPR